MVRTLVPCLLLLLALVACGDGDRPSTPELREVDQIAYGVSQIMVSVTRERSPAQAEVLIRQAERALAKGEAFADVARGRSDHGSAADGGFLGFVRTDGDTAFGGAVQAMRPGQVSPPIHTTLGWHIIKRHSFEEARELERRLRIPTLGVFIAWDDPEHPREAPAGRTKEQAHAIAIDVRNKLGSGDLTLEQAMGMFTPPTHRSPEAYLGPTVRRKENAEVFDALQAARPGELLGPFDTPEGWGVFVRGRFLRSMFRHILIQHTASKDREMSVTRTPAQAAQLAERVLAEVLADRSRWDHLVEAHSDDRYSRAIRGRMGILSPGNMPPGFETFAYEQEPDTIHPAVVQTPYGFHIVWKVN